MEGIVNEDVEDQSNVPMLDPLNVTICGQCKHHLANEIPGDWVSENFGVDYYLRAVNIIDHYTNLQE